MNGTNSSTAVTTSAPNIKCEDCEKNTKISNKMRAEPQETQINEPNKEELEKSIAQELNKKDTKDINDKGFFKKFKSSENNARN